MSRPKSMGTRWLFPALAALVAADFFLTAWAWVGWNSRSGLAQDVWLRYALDFREGRALPLGNDHPLYPALLSLWVRRTISSFTWSKLFSLAVGLFTLVSVARIGAELFGSWEGLLAGAWLACDWLFLSLSMSLRAEVLLPPLFLAGWYAVWRGFREEGAWWLAGGALVGLAYLDKGTGLLFVFAWAGASAVAALRDKKVPAKVPWFLAGFLPLAAALWWANWRYLGDATYNFSTRHALWLDSWWELPGRNIEELTFRNYLASHGWAGILGREFWGSIRFVPVSLECLSPSTAFPLFHVLRWPALAAAAWSAWTLRRSWLGALSKLRGEAWFTAFLFALFFCLFAWYHQVSPSERFVGPLAPIALILLAAAAVPAIGRRIPRRYAAPLGWAAAALLATELTLKAAIWGVQDPFKADRLPPCYSDVLARLEGSRATVLYGPSGELPLWLLKAPPEFRELGGGGLGGGADALVVDWETAGLPALRGCYSEGPDHTVSVSCVPPGWRVAYSDAYHSPPHILMLERGQESRLKTSKR